MQGQRVGAASGSVGRCPLVCGAVRRRRMPCGRPGPL